MPNLTLPDTAATNDTGHTSDHNLIVAAIQDVNAAVDAGPAAGVLEMQVFN